MEVISDEGMVVLRSPGRKFPGLLVQGDALNAWYKSIREIRKGLTKGEDMRSECDYLFDCLDSCMRNYEQVLLDNSINLPYSPNVIGDVDLSP